MATILETVTPEGDIVFSPGEGIDIRFTESDDLGVVDLTELERVFEIRDVGIWITTSDPDNPTGKRILLTEEEVLSLGSSVKKFWLKDSSNSPVVILWEGFIFQRR